LLATLIGTDREALGAADAAIGITVPGDNE
jgi:hypothetical protein